MQETHSLSRVARHTNGHTVTLRDCSLSDKYTEFIATHLDSLKYKCQHFTACINKLIQDVNPVQLLRGNDLSLKNICGLVNPKGSGNYSTLEGKCSATERENIRTDLEHRLEDKLSDPDSWNSVKKCLLNPKYYAERTTRVGEICGLAKKQPVICKKYKIHKDVQTFFNDQIHHLKCTCQILNKRKDDHHSHLPMYAAIGGAGIIVLLVILGICFFCYRRRRKSKDRKRSPNVIYIPSPNSDNHPIYQELYDDMGQTSSNNPPMLPMRYTTHPSALSNQNRKHDEEPTYLEPIEVGYRCAPCSNSIFKNWFYSTVVQPYEDVSICSPRISDEAPKYVTMRSLWIAEIGSILRQILSP